jgi:hypothetical protein
LEPIAVGLGGIDSWYMVQLAIRCHPRVPVAAEELGLARAAGGRAAADVPHATVQLSRLTQGGPSADLELGWLVELEPAEGEPLLNDDRLGDAPLLLQLRAARTGQEFLALTVRTPNDQ